MSRRAAAGVAVLVAVAACSPAPSVPLPAGPPTPSPTPSPPAEDFSAEVRQHRPDEAARRLSLHVHNASRQAVVVEAVRLDSPAFESVAPSPAGDALLGPGQGIDFRADYGPARCGALAGPVTATSVVAQVRLPGAGAVGLPLPAGGSGDLLARIWERECRQQRLAAAVSARLLPEVTETTSAGEAALRTRLELRRLGDEDVRVIGVTGSVSFDLRPEHPEALPTLDARIPTVTVPVLVTAGRCDAHGLGGSTKPFDFSVQLALGGAEPTSLLFTPDDATRRRLFDGLEYLCRGRFEDR